MYTTYLILRRVPEQNGNGADIFPSLEKRGTERNIYVRGTEEYKSPSFNNSFTPFLKEYNLKGLSKSSADNLRQTFFSM